MRAPAPAKINLALVVGPTRADGKHEVATVLQRVDLADRVAIAPGTALAVAGFPADTIVRDALAALAAAAGVDPHWTATISKRIPVAAGLGGGSSDAATALRLANETLDEPLPAADLHAVAATVGADVPFFLADGPQLGRGDGSALHALALPQDYWIVIALPAGAAKVSTAAVYAAFDERGGGSGWEERLARLEAALADVRRPRDLAALPPNDLASSPLADALLRHGAFRADVSGAGPAVYGLFHHRRQAEAARRELRGRGHDLADRSGLVRLRGESRRYRWGMDRPATIEHRSSRFGRRLRENRLRIALLVALVEGILVLVGSIDWWIVVLLALIGVAAYVWRGRDSGREEVREVSWIVAVSQLAVVLVPVLALVLTAFAVVALVLIAVVALVVLLQDRR